MLKKKKGQSGNAAQYLTRNQALKKLQLKLAEFRRLCILKGIHPREPRKKTQGSHKTYYHVKDIAYLQHEPLLKKVRVLLAYQKKIRRASAKRNKELAARLASRRPTYRLDHLVRERYPTFIDAVRDLDDPLTLVHLFAVLPADSTKGIPVEQLQLSRRLAMEWQAWVVRQHALRKVFVSVKGYYYQASVMGQTVTWLVPHQLAQVLPTDVDFRVMTTFLELYQTTLRFVLYKLYQDCGLRYPPVMDSKLEEAAAGFEAVARHLLKSSAVTTNANAPVGINNEDEGEGDVSPAEAARIDSLAARVKALESEIQTMSDPKGKRRTDEDDDEEEESDGDFDEDLEIDSGDDDENEEEESDDDEDDDAEDPRDEDIPAPKQIHRHQQESIEDGSTYQDTPAVPAAMALVGGAIDVDVDDDDAVCATLFRGLRFFLGREVPREQLLMVIKSFGGEAGWDGEGSPYSEADDSITHQVMDRPTQARKFLAREYVQPQWVFDSANARVLVRSELYAPGVAPPPHLSPFVKADDEGYVPEYGREIQQLQEAARATRKQHAGAAAEEEFFGTEKGGTGGMPVAVLSAEAAAAEAERRYAVELATELKDAGHAFDANGIAASPASGADGENKEGQEGKEEDDEERMNDIMMTRKVRKAYQSAIKEREAKRQRVQDLSKKAKALKK